MSGALYLVAAFVYVGVAIGFACDAQSEVDADMEKALAIGAAWPLFTVAIATVLVIRVARKTVRRLK